MIRDVYLWDAAERVSECVELGREYITDIVNSGLSPKRGSILVALKSAPRHGRLVAGIGIVKSSVKVSQGHKRIRVEPLLLTKPQAIKPILDKIDKTIRNRITAAGWPSELRPTRLPPSAAAALLDELSDVEEIRVWLDSALSYSNLSPERLAEVGEVRDAIGLALEVADIHGLDAAALSTPASAYVSADLIASVVKRAHLADSEEDLIPEDLRRFERETQTELVAGHVAILRGYEYELVVFNVNKKPLEVALGVDLVYWDTIKNVFTLVQYKRLDRVASDGDGEWAYTNESEIKKQLELMTTPVGAAASSDDWRMTTPYWFKFVRRDAARFQDGKLLKGMYVPADYMRLAIEDGSLRSGPRGGFRVTYGNTKRVTRSTFAELVRRGLVGTMAAQSFDLVQVVQDLGSSGRSGVIAMKARWEDVGGTDDYSDSGDVFDEPISEESGGSLDLEDLLGTSPKSAD